MGDNVSGGSGLCNTLAGYFCVRELVMRDGGGGGVLALIYGREEGKCPSICPYDGGAWNEVGDVITFVSLGRDWTSCARGPVNEGDLFYASWHNLSSYDCYLDDGVVVDFFF